MRFLLFTIFSVWCFCAYAQDPKPAMPLITSVSVDPATGKCIVKWAQPSVNDTIFRHEVSRAPFSNEGTYFFAPTAVVEMPELEYTEDVPDITTQRQTYRIRSIDRNNDVSPITDAHITMAFNGDYDQCANKFTLRWSRYKKYFIDNSTGKPDESNPDATKFNNAVEYEVWGHEGATFDIASAKKLTPRSKDFYDVYVEQLTLNTKYFMFVKAFLLTGETATSHLLEIPTKNKKLPSIFHIDSVISKNGNINLHINVDRTTEIDTFSVHRADWGRTHKWYYRLSNFPSVYTDSEISFGAVYNYKIYAYICNKAILVSDSVSNVLLNAMPKGQKAELKWTEFFGNNPSDVEYTLHRTEPAPEQILYTGSDLNFLDQTTADSLCAGPKKFCYQLVSDDGKTVARSEKACLTLDPIITMPDAIDPKSDIYSTPNCSCRSQCYNYRSRFGPVFDLADPNYELTIEIFNRAGIRLFGSRKHFDTPLDPLYHYWGGTYNGAYVDEGVYVYSVVINFKNGKTFHNKGTVTVMYAKY